MTLSAILTLAAAVFALAIKPGPGMTMVMSRTISQGISACLAYVIGFCVVSIFFLLIVIFGLKYVPLDLIFISILIKSFAAVYLIHLGIKGLQQDTQSLSIEEVSARNFFDNLTASLILTLSNPLTILFYAGILPTILDIQAITWNDIIIISFVIIVVETLTALAYVSPLLYFRKKIDLHLMERLKVFSSAIIIGVGLYIGYSALMAEDLKAIF